MLQMEVRRLWGNKMRITLDLDEAEAKDFSRILSKQIEKTKWVINNKSPDNEDFLQKRVNLMEDIISQLERKADVSTNEDSMGLGDEE
jgi:hypothetical protein